MTYNEIQKLNRSRRESNAAMYSKLSGEQRKARWLVIAWLLVGGLFIGALVDGIDTHKQVQDITRQQQTQAAQHADDRIWYRSCERLSNGTKEWVECPTNPELAQ